MKFGLGHLQFPKHPLLIAHRGSQIIHKYPENSLPAFKEAVDLGAHGIELDVRLSADNEIMVFHDKTLLRMLGIDKNLHNFSCAQLQYFRFKNTYGNDDLTIPTLAEVFQTFGDKIFYNIEIKSSSKPYSILILKLYKLINDSELRERVWISSFDPIVLWQLHRVDGQIPTAYLFNKWRLKEKWLCNRSFIKILHPGINLLPYREHMNRFKKAICFWTVNSSNDLHKLKNINLLGIISDNIPKSREILGL